MAVDDGLLDTNGSVSNKIRARAKNSALPSGKRAAPTHKRKDPDCEQVHGSLRKPGALRTLAILSVFYNEPLLLPSPGKK